MAAASIAGTIFRVCIITSIVFIIVAFTTVAPRHIRVAFIVLVRLIHFTFFVLIHISLFALFYLVRTFVSRASSSLYSSLRRYEQFLLDG